jgi:predicted nucleic acid-binding protein
MTVIDASVVVEVLLRPDANGAIERAVFESGVALHCPHLLDVEVAQALRRHLRAKEISDERARQALDDLMAFPVHRHTHTALLPRVWDLRHNLTAYDAVYVALAEVLDEPLFTRDKRLATAAGHEAVIEVL